MNGWNRILLGDAADQLTRLPTGSVDTVVTSPAYYLLRDYQVAGQMGLEASVDDWASRLVTVFDQVARVLKPTGSVWLNLGDSYSGHQRYGAAPKSLLLGPERLALALSQRGWIVRNRVVWAKPNAMPTSVRDRLNTTWEVIYLLTRSGQYHFDLDAIRRPHRSSGKPSAAPAQTRGPRPAWAGPLAGSQEGLAKLKAAGLVGHALGANPGDVITTPSSNFRGAHFATFPKALVRPLLLATCPEQVCTACGVPWQRQRYRQVGRVAMLGAFRRGCTCPAAAVSGTVLDPFMGAGTVALVAEELGRRWLGIELNPDFVTLAEERLRSARGSPGSRAA